MIPPTATLTAKQIKAKQQQNHNILNPGAPPVQNSRSLTPNLRTSNTFEVSSAIAAYKDPRKHVETVASLKDFGLPRNLDRENSPTYKSKLVSEHLTHFPEGDINPKQKTTQQEKPRPNDFTRQVVAVTDARKESTPDLLVGIESRDAYHREKEAERSSDRAAKSQQMALKHAKLDYDWDAKHKMPVKIDRGNNFIPQYRDLSPIVQKRQELYSTETLNKSPLRLQTEERAPRRNDYSADSPSTRQQFVNMKRHNENTSDVFNATSKSRKGEPAVLAKKDLNLEICPADCKWSDRYTENRYKNSDAAVPNNFASQRRAQEYSSNIFNRPEKETKHQSRASPRKGDRLDFQDHENENIRRKDRGFSDLFEIPTYQPPTDRSKNDILPKSPEYSIPTNANVTDSHFEAFSQRSKTPNENYSIKDKRQENRASALDSETLKNNSEKFRGGSVKESPIKERGGLTPIGIEHREGAFNLRGTELTPDQENPDHTKNMLKSYTLTSVPKSIDEKLLKKLFSGIHLVDLHCDVNSVTNKPLGSAQVKIRSDDEESIKSLQQKLKKVGIYMTSQQTKTGKNNNYAENKTVEWRDKNLQREEKRLTQRQKIVPKISKREDMQSEGEVYGNSKGHGKWPTNWDTITNVKLDSQKDYHATAHWDRDIKKSPTVKNKQNSIMDSNHFLNRPRTAWK